MLEVIELIPPKNGNPGIVPPWLRKPDVKLPTIPKVASVMEAANGTSTEPSEPAFTS